MAEAFDDEHKASMVAIAGAAFANRARARQRRAGVSEPRPPTNFALATHDGHDGLSASSATRC
jgi:hypothetical protein